MALAFLSFCVLVPVGCEESFEPLTPTDAVFSLYGYLDSDAAEQVVRVVPLRDRLRRGYSESDLTFNTSTDGPEGVTVWQNRLFLTSDDENALGSAAAFRPAGGEGYRIRVEDPATGRYAEAETRLPEPIPSENLLFDTIYEREMSWVQNLFLDGVVDQHFMEAIYTVRNRASQKVDSVSIAYQGQRAGRRVEDRGTAYVLLLQEDADSVYKALGMRSGNRQLELIRIQMRISSLSAEWDMPAGIRDPAVLSAPGVWSNVSFGLGFFGGVTRTRRNVPTLPTEVVAGMGF